MSSDQGKMLDRSSPSTGRSTPQGERAGQKPTPGSTSPLWVARLLGRHLFYTDHLEDFKK